MECPECDKSSPSYKGFGQHYNYQHEGNPLIALHGSEKLSSMYNEMSENKMSKVLDVGRTSVKKALLEIESVNRRSQPEAENFKWDNMTEEKKEIYFQNLREGHKTQKELMKKGEHPIQIEWRENTEEMRERMKEIGSLGADARDENGMKGVTGQDHPGWRGGKCIYDAVKKQLRPTFNSVKSDYRVDECYMCGDDIEENGRKLDVHHIIPVLCGGDNGEWNSMTLCRGCHKTAESYTRDLFEPVLTKSL